VENIINEDIGDDVVSRLRYAIENNLYVSLYYNDGKGGSALQRNWGNPRAYRRIVPYCLGTKNGRYVLRCFHAYKTNTKRGPFKWKFLYVDNMKNVRVLTKFPKVTERNIPNNFNPNGDKHMDSIIAIMRFNGGNNKTPSTNMSPQKTDNHMMSMAKKAHEDGEKMENNYNRGKEIKIKNIPQDVVQDPPMTQPTDQQNGDEEMNQQQQPPQ
jgi:hypothetical protein